MKRKFISAILALALLFPFTGVSNALTEKDIPIYVDGVRLEMDHGPGIEDGQTLVPAEEFLKALGATVKQETYSISATKGLIQERISYDFGSVELNGEKFRTGNHWLHKVDNVTYVPLRNSAEGFFATVELKDGSIYVTTNKTGYAEYPGVPDFGKLYSCQEKPIKISESETETPYKNNDGSLAFTVVSHDSTFIHTYNSPTAITENVEKYKEELKKCGYEFYTSRENDTVKAEFYKNADGSMVSVSSAMKRLCIITITVPVSLENLGLKATKN